MAKMNLSPNSRNVRRLSKMYGMPESDVREMLAIESGRSKGDVVFADELPTRPGIRSRGVSLLKALFRMTRWTRRHPKDARVEEHRGAGQEAGLLD